MRPFSSVKFPKLAFLVLVLCLAAAGTARAFAQAPPPQETPIPLNEDPNDPQADRKTRIERQEALIRKQLEERRRRLEAIRLQREQAAQQQNGQPDPNNPQLINPPPQADGQQPGRPVIGYPSDGAPAMANQNPNQPQVPNAMQPGHQPFGQPDPGGFPASARAPGANAAAKGPVTNQVTFYIKPATLVMNVGENIVTETGLLNPSGISYDRVEVALRFPPHAIRPIAIHEATIRPLLKSDAESELDLARGTFIYRGELTSATQARSVPLVTIEWEAVGPARQAQIATRFGESRSGAYRGDRFVSAGGLGESQLGANLRIGQEDGAMPTGLLMVNEESMAEAVPAFNENQAEPPRLWIEQPSDGEFQPGQWVVIDVGIDNPAGVAFDEVRLAARFDPDAVELADTDRDNLINRGRNVLDGPFRNIWPWEMLYANRIDQEQGQFYYRMASFDTVTTTDGSAPLIRVFARIKQPVKAPLLRWIWNPEASVEWPQTGIYRMNRNLFVRASETGATAKAGLHRQRPFAGGVVALDAYERADKRDYQF